MVRSQPVVVAVVAVVVVVVAATAVAAAAAAAPSSDWQAPQPRNRLWPQPSSVVVTSHTTSVALRRPFTLDLHTRVPTTSDYVRQAFDRYVKLIFETSSDDNDGDDNNDNDNDNDIDDIDDIDDVDDGGDSDGAHATRQRVDVLVDLVDDEPASASASASAVNGARERNELLRTVNVGRRRQRQRHHSRRRRRAGVLEHGDTDNDEVRRVLATTRTLSFDTLHVRVGEDGVFFTPGDDESYTLVVNASGIFVDAPMNWGALRALETLSQLVVPHSVLVPALYTIVDRPRFAWRGILLDTARHWFPKQFVLDLLESASYAKLNVLHWHIVDGQSFPYVSRRFPELSAKGAYSATQVYTPADVADIVAAANARGILVLPEFDIPAHATSWGYGMPALTMQHCAEQAEKCTPPPYATRGLSDGCGDVPFNPAQNYTYDVLRDFFAEMWTAFPSAFVHLGGDELQYRIDCWNTTAINRFMAEQHIAAGDYYALQAYFVQRTDALASYGGLKRVVHWQELFNENTTLPANSVVQVWKDHATLNAVVKAGFDATLSFGWYLDSLSTSWQSMYANEPLDAQMSAAERARVLGGEACAWAETLDASNAMPEIWPRLAAVAERLWSPLATTASLTNITADRMHCNRCRMLARGVPSRPLGPGWCY